MLRRGEGTRGTQIQVVLASPMRVPARRSTMTSTMTSTMRSTMRSTTRTQKQNRYKCEYRVSAQRVGTRDRVLMGLIGHGPHGPPCIIRCVGSLACTPLYCWT